MRVASKLWQPVARAFRSNDGFGHSLEPLDTPGPPE
jgi:hypothetical protein